MMRINEKLMLLFEKRSFSKSDKTKTIEEPLTIEKEQVMMVTESDQTLSEVFEGS
jgi:hypothetical protein